MGSYEEYEKKVKENEAENEKALALFEEDLKAAGLGEKTIRNHLNNVEFFLNTYLQRADALTLREGTGQMSDYFGWFFIRKCMWSTPASIKTTAASLKKFYKCMKEHGLVDAEEYEELADDIKYGMEGWQDECRRYNNPDEDDPFSIDFDF